MRLWDSDFLEKFFTVMTAVQVGKDRLVLADCRSYGSFHRDSPEVKKTCAMLHCIVGMEPKQSSQRCSRTSAHAEMFSSACSLRKQPCAVASHAGGRGLPQAWGLTSSHSAGKTLNLEL